MIQVLSMFITTDYILYSLIICAGMYVLGLCDNFDYEDNKFIIMIKIILIDNSKFPDTIVYYIKNTNMLVHSNFGSKVYA